MTIIIPANADQPAAAEFGLTVIPLLLPTTYPRRAARSIPPVLTPTLPTRDDSASIDVSWNPIIACSGEVFHLPRGKSFTYSVSGDTVYLDTANQNLSRHQIAEALGRMPLTGPDDIGDLDGSRYIYAILMDRRIAGR